MQNLILILFKYRIYQGKNREVIALRKMINDNLIKKAAQIMYGRPLCIAI